jgi:hypothetical protein
VDGVITFNNPQTGLVDSTGAAIADGTVIQTQVIPKRCIQMMRVVEQVDDTNPNKLLALALRFELPAVSDGTGAPAVPDVVVLALLNSPTNATIPSFFSFVATVTGKLSSNVDEVIAYKANFP